MSVDHIETHLYQLQFTMPQIVTQNYVKDCVLNIIPKLSENLSWVHGGFNCTGTHPECRPWPMGRSGFILLL